MDLTIRRTVNPNAHACDADVHYDVRLKRKKPLAQLSAYINWTERTNQHLTLWRKQRPSRTAETEQNVNLHMPRRTHQRSEVPKNRRRRRPVLNCPHYYEDDGQPDLYQDCITTSSDEAEEFAVEDTAGVESREAGFDVTTSPTQDKAVAIPIDDNGVDPTYVEVLLGSDGDITPREENSMCQSVVLPFSALDYHVCDEDESEDSWTAETWSRVIVDDEPEEWEVLSDVDSVSSFDITNYTYADAVQSTAHVGTNSTRSATRLPSRLPALLSTVDEDDFPALDDNDLQHLSHMLKGGGALDRLVLQHKAPQTDGKTPPHRGRKSGIRADGKLRWKRY